METLVKYVTGDVRSPLGAGRKLIIHCCNDIGRMGAGVAKSLFKKWPDVRNRYLYWYENEDKPFELGQIQAVLVESDIAVINMIGQHDIKWDEDGNPPIRYDAIRECLVKVRGLALGNQATVHAPKFGSDLAGGDWRVIEGIIDEELTAHGVEVTVYNFEG